MRAVHTQLNDVANIVNSMYAPLNIVIKLVGVVVWSERDEIEIVPDAEVTLAQFAAYRSKALGGIKHDNAHLITRQRFLNGVLGIAYVGKMCAYDSVGLTSNLSRGNTAVAETLAHEMGHNLDMEHDTERCGCSDKCIMAPYEN